MLYLKVECHRVRFLRLRMSDVVAIRSCRRLNAYILMTEAPFRELTVFEDAVVTVAHIINKQLWYRLTSKLVLQNYCCCEEKSGENHIMMSFIICVYQISLA